jgi:hypothetical protein
MATILLVNPSEPLHAAASRSSFTGPCSNNAASTTASRRHAEPGGREVEGALPVRKCTHDSRPPPNLAHDALEWIIRADAPPVLAAKGQVSERPLREPLCVRFGTLLRFFSYVPDLLHLK